MLCQHTVKNAVINMMTCIVPAPGVLVSSQSKCYFIMALVVLGPLISLGKRVGCHYHTEKCQYFEVNINGMLCLLVGVNVDHNLIRYFEYCLLLFTVVRLFVKLERGARYLAVENLKVVRAKFSTLS
jgi:hypothetical protein